MESACCASSKCKACGLVTVNAVFVAKWYFGLTWIYIASLISMVYLVVFAVKIRLGREVCSGDKCCSEECIQSTFWSIYVWSNKSIQFLRDTIVNVDSKVSNLILGPCYTLFDCCCFICILFKLHCLDRIEFLYHLF